MYEWFPIKNISSDIHIVNKIAVYYEKNKGKNISYL